MGTKYCDICSDELTKKNSPSSRFNPDRLGGEMSKDKKLLRFEVITGNENDWNAGRFCVSCIVEAILTRVGLNGRE